MAIRSQVLANKSVTAAVDSINTHTNNVQDPKPLTGDQNLKNNQEPLDLLVDPEATPGTNGDGGIYTHENNDKDVKAEGGSGAARSDKKPGKVKASSEDGESPAQAQNPDPAETINISTIPNDVNPLDGYPLKDNCAPGVLEEGQGGDSSVESATETGLENNQQGEQKLGVEASQAPGATTNQPGMPQNSAPLVSAEDDANDWVEGPNPADQAQAPGQDGGAPTPAPAPAPAAPAPAPVAPAPVAPAPVAPVPAPAPMAPPVVPPAIVPVPEVVEPAPLNLGMGDDESFEGEDVMSILDADDVADEDCGDMAFAEMGANVLVLKGPRVIASMTEQEAVTAGVDEDFRSEQFQEATIAECRRYGLRAGLESMGFQLAEVNIGRSDVINARVQARVQAATQNVVASYASKDTSFGHCLAIAAVGINRNFWNDVPNELRAALENQLTAAGLRNASKVVRQVFAQYGTSYAKSIVAMATRLSAMSEETRNELAGALDLINLEGKFEDPMEDEENGTEVHASMDQDDYDAPASVTAALSFAGHTNKGVLLTPKQAGYSVTAAAFLNSDELLF